MHISVSQANKHIGSARILHDLNEDFAPSKIHALTGASGSGKSTLLNCIGLIDHFTDGNLHYGDKELNRASERLRRTLRRDHVGYLFQDYALVDYETVRTNIEYAMVGRYSRQERRRKISGALDRVGLADRADSRIFELSGGQRQRVALARNLVRNVDVVLADEPTGALDRENAKLVMQVLRDMASHGACVIVATHDSWIVDKCDTHLNLKSH